jgi:hypothetical protein
MLFNNVNMFQKLSLNYDFYPSIFFFKKLKQNYACINFFLHFIVTYILLFTVKEKEKFLSY